MPKKKSVKLCARNFQGQVDEILKYLAAAIGPGTSKEHASWAHEFAIIRLYREFESLVQGALVGAINNDTSTLSARTGIDFPKHLTDEVCKYLLIADGYFDFRGRDGLLKTVKRFVPESHYLVGILRNNAYKDTLERLSAFRNFAAHFSSYSKANAKKAVNAKRLHSAGAWLKRSGRFRAIADRLKTLANEIEAKAPY